MTMRSRVRRLRPRRLTFLPEIANEPEQQLPPSEIRRGMRISISEGFFAQIWGSLTVGSFVTGLALQLGADNFALGLIQALPVASQLIQLFAAVWVERRGNRRFISVVSSLGRPLWIIPPILLFVPMDGALRLWLSILVFAIAAGMFAITANAWLNWMSDLIPPALRGRFFGTRNTVVSIVAMATLWAGGAGLDIARSNGEINFGYLVLFGVASFSGLISTFILARQPEPPMRSAPRQPMRAMLGAPLRDRRFRLFMLTLLVWGFFVNLASPFFGAYALKNLHVGFQELATLDVVTAATAILVAPFWGRLADRAGQKRVMTIGMLGACPLALSWLFPTHETFWLLYINSILSGVFWTGFNLALNNRLMELAPAVGRGSYLAAYSAITGITAFSAALLGGVLIDIAANVRLETGPFVWGNYQIIFMAAGAGRILLALTSRRNL